jgi:uncharacterized protein
MSAHLPPVERDEASAAFFDAAARGQLLVKKSAVSGTVLAPEARTDPTCGSSDLAPCAVSGDGTLVSWTVVHRPPLPLLAASVPYVSAIVELDEGPWLIVRLLADDPEQLHAGVRVQARFQRSGEADEQGEVVPVFEPQPRTQ